MKIPIVWERFLAEATKELESANTRYPAALREYEKEKRAWDRSGKETPEPKRPARPRPRMQEGEDDNFLRFAAFLKIVVGNSIRIDTLPTIKELLQDYLLTFLNVRLAQPLSLSAQYSLVLWYWSDETESSLGGPYPRPDFGLRSIKWLLGLSH
jgi:hypothetical protein